MPITPFHFGAHAAAVLPLEKKLDVPVFVLSNVVIDIEPLLVLVFNLNYPFHGYAHTFIGGAIVGIIWGSLAYKLRMPLGKLMELFKLSYSPSLKTAILSGITGCWLHVLFDSPINTDIKPFYPLSVNPFYGLISILVMHLLCVLLFIPAFVLYIRAVKNNLTAASREPLPGSDGRGNS